MRKGAVVYDEYGLSEVRCFGCDVVIKVRDEIESKKFRDKTLFTMRELSNFKQVVVLLDDGSYTVIPVCIDCEKKNHDVNSLTQKRVDTELENLRASKRPDVEITLLMEREGNLKIEKILKDSKDLNIMKQHFEKAKNNVKNRAGR